MHLRGLIALLCAASALSVASAAAAKPLFEPGDYLGTVAAKNRPEVAFTVTPKQVKRLKVDAQPVTCSDDRVGTINLPTEATRRPLRIRKGRFELKVTSGSSSPDNAGTRLTGKLRGLKASGTLRVVLDAGDATCDTGVRRWSARLDEVIVRLP